MAEPLKNVYSKEFFIPFLSSWKEINPKVDQDKFLTQLFGGNWDDLELKERMSKISETLGLFLNHDYKIAADELKSLCNKLLADGFPKDSFEFMFLPEFIEKNGLEQLSISLDAIEVITQFTSCEFAIRPFILKYQKEVLDQMLQWSYSKNDSLRRFSSEGCRPRLPWAMALPELKVNPSPILGILENLKNDSSLFVRKSVANNLNDISKDHPELIVKIAKEWQGASKETDWIVKHACRTLLKAGDATAMQLFGYSKESDYTLNNFSIEKKEIKMNTTLGFAFEIENSSETAILLRLEYGIDFLKANGQQNRKVFKISERKLKPQEKVVIEKKHPIKPISTRKYYEGEHGIALIVNGIEKGKDSFQLSF